jgi:hypothetical protein
MFRFFPVAAADRFNVDEQAFIFVPKFRVQVARLARRISAGAIRRVPARLAGHAVANSRCGRCAQTKSFSILSN